jgi:hypothetical protein
MSVVVSQSRMVPRKAETARCIFCGKVGVWWDCGCEWGEKIRAGKLAKPRTVVRGGVPVIELCEELRAAARLAGVITREYRQSEPVRENEPPLPGESEPPVQNEPVALVQNEPVGSREEKRRRILAQILGNPDLSDRAISMELGVSRATVASVRAMMKAHRRK